MKKRVAITSCIAVFLTSVFFTTATVSAQQPPDNQSDMTITDQIKAQALDVLTKSLRTYYVFPDMGNKVADMIEGRQKRGEYNSVVSAKEFAQLLTKQMLDVAHDGHMGVKYSANNVQPGMAGQTMLQELKANYCFDEVKRLDGNIGYLKFDCFQEPDQAGPTLAAAIAFLANTDAMLIDLRDNHGGTPLMVATVASYFFSGDRPVLLNTTEMRKPGTNEYTVPKQSWTLPYVSGQRYLNKEVYILTSHHTFSGGEEFSYDMQTQKRATLVGETTGGGANMPMNIRLVDHLWARIPHGQGVNPVTHTNWEGVGVKPEIETPVQDALKVAQKTALEHLIANATDERELYALKSALAIVEASPVEQKQ